MSIICLFIFLAVANIKSDSIELSLDTISMEGSESTLVNPYSVEDINIDQEVNLLRAGSPSRVLSSQNFIFYVFLGLFVLLAFIRFNFRLYVSRLNKGLFNLKLTQQFYRDEYQGLGREIIFLSLLILLVFTLYFYFVFERMGLSFTDLDDVRTLIIFTILLTYFLIRYFSVKITAWLFRLDLELGLYQFTFFQGATVLSVAILPFLLIIAFGTEWMKLPALLISTLFILVWIIFGYIRGIGINSKFLNSHKFHFFIYLCALEISPLVILYTIAGNLISN